MRICPLDVTLIQPIADAFLAIGWNKPAAQYAQYLAEQNAGTRTVFVALLGEIFAGYVTVNWQSSYPPFQAQNIPEIQDFNVLPHFRRQGIGAALMDEAEKIIFARGTIVGIGVGLYADYGSAQRMYAKRGYIPDGRGVYWRDQVVSAGETVTVDDDLVLYFTKHIEP